MSDYGYTYKIGDCTILLRAPFPCETEEAFIPFAVDGQRCDTEVRFIQTEVLPPYTGERFTPPGDAEYSVVRCNGEFVWLFHAMGETYPYAALYPLDDEHWECRFLARVADHFRTIGALFRHIALESILLRRNRLILHASVIRTEYGGILFVGPSGIGKSTQAALWQQHAGAEILNGDRAVCACVDGVWTAYGSPVAGSSRIHLSESVPIRAIVSLKKSADDRAELLSGTDAFRAIYKELTANTWDVKAHAAAVDLALLMSRDVPALMLSCTPTRTAVTCLRTILDSCME